jgi:hypothetical protein
VNLQVGSPRDLGVHQTTFEWLYFLVKFWAFIDLGLFSPGLSALYVWYLSLQWIFPFLSQFFYLKTNIYIVVKGRNYSSTSTSYTKKLKLHVQYVNFRAIEMISS